MNVLRNQGLYCAWVLSLAGFFMSLYFSEIEWNEPCTLCWLQRIALFPLVIQLGIATYRSDEQNAYRYCFPLVLFGFGVGLYQSILPELGSLSSCHCETAQIPQLFDMIPFPWLSTGGFFAIGILLLLTRKKGTPSL